jgi:hypothetical protein
MMMKILDFRDYIKEQYDDELRDSLSLFIDENPNALECSTKLVCSPDTAELAELWVKYVDISNGPGTVIRFDVIVEAEIEIHETTRYGQEADEASQWFRISCSADLDNGLHNFEIHGVSVYNQHRSRRQDSLSGSLVPYISRDMLEDEAEDFLRRFYPEALRAPIPLPVEAVAGRMGLKAQSACLSKSHTIFGAMCFDTCSTKLYDEDTDTYISVTISEKTIIYDPGVFFMRSLGSVRNTVIHECVHWDKHKKAFDLQKLYNPDSCTIRCSVVEGTRTDNERSPEDWMEWQANALAPKILMPFRMAKTKAEAIIARNKQTSHMGELSDIIETVISEMADFFQVSKISAKIRMIDLGYEEAIGAFSYIDDHYVPAHAFAPGMLKRNQTFVIDARDALMQYGINLELRKLLDSGKYLYVDSRYCINHPKYIQTNENGKPELTEYARAHSDECCLVFDIKVTQNRHYSAKHYTECVLYRDVAFGSTSEPEFQNNSQNQSVELLAQELQQLDETTAFLRSLPGSFCATLKAHMERAGVTVEELAEASLLARKTIQRMRTEEEHTPKLSSIVAVCIGLHINPVFSDDLLRKAGIAPRATNEYISYKCLLSTWYQKDIFECNELLAEYGIAPLGNEE